MNILYIDHYAGSDRYGMEFRPFYMAREWVKKGSDVTIIAADYSHLRRENPIIKNDFSEEYDSGVRFCFVRSVRYRSNGLKRACSMISFVNKLKQNADYIAKKYNPDVVINSSTYPMDVYPAHKIAKIAGAKLFYEIHDLWPMSLVAMSRLTDKNPLIKYVQKAENYCYKNCDGVVSILPDADRHIKELGFNNVNFNYVPNGVVIGESEYASLNSKHKKVLDDLHKDNKFVVMYAGGHARSNALDCFVECGKLVSKDTALVLVGNGSEKQKLQSFCEKQNISNVVFLDAVPKNEMQSLLKEADCLYIGAKKSPLYSYGVGMNKMFDYMLSARPVINGVEAPDTPLELAGCGISVPAQNPSEIALAIEKIKNISPSDREIMGKKGQEYVLANHRYEVLAEKFINIISKGENI